MQRLRFPMFLLIAALGLGLMGGVLLAQPPENAHAPIDCTPEGLTTLLQEMNTRHLSDHGASPRMMTFYSRGMAYLQFAVDCGYKPASNEGQISTGPLNVAPDPAEQPQVVGLDPQIAFAQIANLTGDSARGRGLFNGDVLPPSSTVLGCSACHTGGAVAPDTEKIWDRTINTRLKLPMFATYTPEQYVVESIIKPEAYMTAGYMVKMPHDFGERLMPQDLADIVAYLHSLSTQTVTQ